MFVASKLNSVRRATPTVAFILSKRCYHGERVFGHMPPPKRSEIPDYPEGHLQNRNANAALLRYVDNVRRHGHRAAKIDPLNLMARESEVAALDPSRYGLRSDEKMATSGILRMPQDISNGDHTSRVQAISQHLQQTYVSSIGFEFMHMHSKGARNWFMDLLESGAATRPVDSKTKLRIWELMARSECLDQFLQAKLPNVKRYGLEGAEAMIPCLDALFGLAAEAKIPNVVLCMPHRGRLGLLTELLEMPSEILLSKMRGEPEVPDQTGIVGDVLSHLTAAPTLKYDNGSVRVEMLPNPSHLEAVNPVAAGLTRAMQTFGAVKDGQQLGFEHAMCVQIHGDAAFAGQGVVMETLGLSELPHFAVGGSVHLIVNNQLGFSTPSSYGRSSMYASDVAKMIGAPVLHVNGDNPEAVLRAVSVAFAYRQNFLRDVFIDLVSYRRWGHNELDEPAFTQPVMYRTVRTRKSVPEQYEAKLIEEKVLAPEKAQQVRQERMQELDSALRSEGTLEAYVGKPLRWEKVAFSTDSGVEHDPDTGVDTDRLCEIGDASVTIPDGIEPHSRLARHIKQRKDSLKAGKGILWATAESLAFGSLLDEGYDVRLSGQDVGRGTFSQRHLMVVDQKDENIHVPLNAAQLGNGRLEVVNSSLSEQGVLGFELGVSWHRPDLLPIWEAQFGDFQQGAQVIIDTFLASGEAKWMRQSALTMLLPHGLEGGGPELANDPFEPESEPFSPNMIVANPTTPAQFFHLLRRQMLRKYRKPLVVATPKGLLRAVECTSELSDFAPGMRFQEVLPEVGLKSSSGSPRPRRLIFTSGRHYYTLLKARSTLQLDAGDAALIRIEQLSPFPFEQLRKVLESVVGPAAEWVWAQEEPRNQGAGPHVLPRLEALRLHMFQTSEAKIGDVRVRYVGRKESAVPATGVGAWYKAELDALAREPFAGL
ncbi:hypothetical protein OC861_003633 [Tilletia horrida]|nr:hypothetical protein OC861_003633 [Tilletia horrida]